MIDRRLWRRGDRTLRRVSTKLNENVENDRASSSNRCVGCGECDGGGDGDLVF